MPPTNTDDGLRAAAAIRKREPALPIVVLSQYVSVAYLDELLDDDAEGGVGYLLKERVGHVRQFLDAVARVARGEAIIDPDVVRALVKATGVGVHSRHSPRASGRCSRWSPRGTPTPASRSG